MTQLAWVYRGPLAGRDFLPMEDADLEQAVRDDWAQPATGGSGSAMFPTIVFHAVEQGPHEAAEAYAVKKGYVTREPGYATREIVAGPPPKLAPPKKVEEDEADAKGTPKRKPTPKKP